MHIILDLLAKIESLLIYSHRIWQTVLIIVLLQRAWLLVHKIQLRRFRQSSGKVQAKFRQSSGEHPAHVLKHSHYAELHIKLMPRLLKETRLLKMHPHFSGSFLQNNSGVAGTYTIRFGPLCLELPSHLGLFRKLKRIAGYCDTAFLLFCGCQHTGMRPELVPRAPLISDSIK